MSRRIAKNTGDRPMFRKRTLTKKPLAKELSELTGIAARHLGLSIFKLTPMRSAECSALSSVRFVKMLVLPIATVESGSSPLDLDVSIYISEQST